MRGIILIPAVLVVALGAVSADEHDLTGGVFICHYDPQITWTPIPFCELYFQYYEITSCEEQNPSIMTSDERVWYVLSAFNGDKEWCGTEFGFGQFDPYCYIFTWFGPCPFGGNLEISTDYWPGPGEGTAIVTTDLPWRGNFYPTYYFTGYAYYGPCQIPLDVHPTTGFAGWENCLSPPQSFGTACFPAMGVLMEGIECCPEAPICVCCVGQDCFLITADECSDIGGEYHPEWDSCDPNPCVPSPSATASWGVLKKLYR
jgi:hypothetical protein